MTSSVINYFPMEYIGNKYLFWVITPVLVVMLPTGFWTFIVTDMAMVFFELSSDNIWIRVASWLNKSHPVWVQNRYYHSYLGHYTFT